jgi:hypothetical protein
VWQDQDVPEGPSFFLLREQVARFEGSRITHAEGNAKTARRAT